MLVAKGGAGLCSAPRIGTNQLWMSGSSTRRRRWALLGAADRNIPIAVGPPPAHTPDGRDLDSIRSDSYPASALTAHVDPLG